MKDSYKYQIYWKMNTSLNPSPFFNLQHPLTDTIIKFRLGSHKLPIETGCWKGLKSLDRSEDVIGYAQYARY